VITKPLRDAYENRDAIREKAKDLPMTVLQGALSGVGHALLIGDRLRNAIKRAASGEEDTSPAPDAGKPREPVIYAPRPNSEPPAQPVAEPAGEPAAEVAEVAEVVEPAGEPVAEVPEPAAEVADEPVAEPAAASNGATPDALAEPIPGYGDLTIASLRARLRGRTADQVRELLAYETATANRGDVVRLYENRLAKLETEATG
jgi:hypothetical protein